MTIAILEHANYSVSNPKKTAQQLVDIFGWHIRWEGPSKGGGVSVHVGTDSAYLALYAQPGMGDLTQDTYQTVGGLNHLAVVVDDISVIEKRVRAAGLRMGDHYDYEPGPRFYFYDDDGIEYEVCSYS